MVPGGGYATVDTRRQQTFRGYVAPQGERIPLLPLIVALYHRADPGIALGMHPRTVDWARFATDFHFSTHELGAYFDASETHPGNAAVLAAQPSSGWVAPAATPAVADPVLPATEVLPPAVNTGFEAEELVASALRARGWTCTNVSRQRPGYDILAVRGRRTLYVEVKSSVGACSPELTAREWQVAGQRGADYVLAVIEHLQIGAPNRVHWIRDPANHCTAMPRQQITHAIPRGSWTAATVALDDLLATP